MSISGYAAFFLRLDMFSISQRDGRRALRHADGRRRITIRAIFLCVEFDFSITTWSQIIPWWVLNLLSSGSNFNLNCGTSCDAYAPHVLQMEQDRRQMQQIYGETRPHISGWNPPWNTAGAGFRVLTYVIAEETSTNHKLIAEMRLAKACFSSCCGQHPSGLNQDGRSSRRGSSTKRQADAATYQGPGKTSSSPGRFSAESKESSKTKWRNRKQVSKW